jgi:hypothetical protein
MDHAKSTRPETLLFLWHGKSLNGNTSVQNLLTEITVISVALPPAGRVRSLLVFDFVHEARPSDSGIQIFYRRQLGASAS